MKKFYILLILRLIFFTTNPTKPNKKSFGQTTKTFLDPFAKDKKTDRS